MKYGLHRHFLMREKSEEKDFVDDIDFYLMDLESRFPKDRENYYLSYSGGRDSHFLLWFIKEYLHDTKIQIVSFNTYMEFPEILARMRKYSDVMIVPEMKPFEIKEKYGSPCFSKFQDFLIEEWQHGKRPSWLMERVFGLNLKTGENMGGRFTLSKKARNLLFDGKLHAISPKCCDELKKKPARRYEKETRKHPILGVRSSESAQRSVMYKACFTKSGKFTPLYDLSDDMLNRIYKRFNIEVPEIYNCVSRTGCAGCPYGSWLHETKTDLDLLPDARRKFVIELFKESYDILDIDYNTKQERLF